MSKTKVISFANNKGGSGKSTTCANIGFSLSATGKKVLLIDGDMQLNLTLSFFKEDEAMEIAKCEKNLYQAIKIQADLSNYIYNTKYNNLDIIPSSILMSGIEYELFTKWQREFILKKALHGIIESENYDYILIDAPPTLGGWVMNIMAASNSLIIPVEASPWGLFGLANMFEFLNEAKLIAGDLSLLGIVLTKVDTRKNYFKQTLEYLKEFKDVHLFNTFIRLDSSIEWSQENSQPVGSYKKSSRSSKEYFELTKEVDEIASR